MTLPSSRAAEDYLKAILRLETDEGRVRTSVVARRLGVAGPSVTSMVHRLAAAGLVTTAPDRTILLTSVGRETALRVVRRHRLIETLLYEVLGVPWDELHDEAEALEHALSDRLEARVDEVLGHPTHDPHGDPIPPADGRDHVEVWPRRLDDIPFGASVRIERISDEDSAALVHLAGIGVGPGCEVVVDHLDPSGGPLWIEVDGRLHALSRDVAHGVAGSVQ